MSNQVSLSHVSLAATDKVAEISKSIFDKTCIDFFSYGRNYDDGSILSLQSDPQALRQMFEDEQKLCGFYMPDGKHLWEHAISQAQISKHQALGYKQGYIIQKQAAGYKEIFCFATKTATPEFISLIMNQHHVLDNFILYFKDAGSKLIENASQTPIFVPESMKLADSYFELKPSVNEEVPSAQPRKYKISSIEGEISLSKREYECIKLQLQGLTAQESGDILGLSSKSVEAYLAIARTKFKAKSRSELIQKIWAMEVADVFLI